MMFAIYYYQPYRLIGLSVYPFIGLSTWFPMTLLKEICYSLYMWTFAYIRITQKSRPIFNHTVYNLGIAPLVLPVFTTYNQTSALYYITCMLHYLYVHYLQVVSLMYIVECFKNFFLIFNFSYYMLNNASGKKKRRWKAFLIKSSEYQAHNLLNCRISIISIDRLIAQLITINWLMQQLNIHKKVSKAMNVSYIIPAGLLHKQ